MGFGWMVGEVPWVGWYGCYGWCLLAGDFKLSTHELTRNKLLGQRARSKKNEDRAKEGRIAHKMRPKMLAVAAKVKSFKKGA